MLHTAENILFLKYATVSLKTQKKYEVFLQGMKEKRFYLLQLGTKGGDTLANIYSVPSGSPPQAKSSPSTSCRGFHPNTGEEPST